MTTEPTTIPVSLEQRNYLGWPAYALRRGELELVAAPGIGGRLIRVAWRGRDLAFTDPAYHGRVLDLARFPDPRAAKREFGWRHYGGEKTWLAPQSRWTDGLPYLDLDSGPYQASVEENSDQDVRLTLTSSVDRETGIEIARTIRLSARRAGFEVTHTVRNASGKLAQWGMCSVFQIRRPGRVYLPRRKGSRFPAGVRSFDHGQSAQVRDAVVKTTGPIAIVDCSGDAPFKFGVDSDQGWVVGIHQNGDGALVGYASAFEVLGRRPYGDGCTVEVGNSDRHPFFDLAVHGPLTLLAPGQQTSLLEQRLLFTVSQPKAGEGFDADSWPENEDQVRALIANAST